MRFSNDKAEGLRTKWGSCRVKEWGMLRRRAAGRFLHSLFSVSESTDIHGNRLKYTGGLLKRKSGIRQGKLQKVQNSYLLIFGFWLRSAGKAG